MTPSLSLTSSSTKRGLDPLGCLQRLSVLAGHTFTQLVRMKIFYFMLVFCIVLFIAGFLLSSISPDQELKLLKDTAFGVMQIFSAVFGIVSMALLLPKDLEDRTLYTILSKPVRRWEYLLGKYFGVLLVLALSLIFMDLLSLGVLQVKLNIATEATRGMFEEKLKAGLFHFEHANQYEELVNEATGSLSDQGPRWLLQMAVLAIFLKASVATAVALLVSTFAGSTIFTILVSLSFYVAGHVQASAREAILEPITTGHHGPRGPVSPEKPQGPGVLAKAASAGISVAFPDFQAFNVVDAIVVGKTVPPGTFLKILGLTAVYLLVYLGLAAFIFSGKEL